MPSPSLREVRGKEWVYQGRIHNWEVIFPSNTWTSLRRSVALGWRVSTAWGTFCPGDVQASKLSLSSPLLESEVAEENLIKLVNIFQLFFMCLFPCLCFFYFLKSSIIYSLNPLKWHLMSVNFDLESPFLILPALFFIVTIFWGQRLYSLPQYWSASTILSAARFYPILQDVSPTHSWISFPDTLVPISISLSRRTHLLSYSASTCVTGIVV